MLKKYSYKDLDGLVDINTLSPNKKIYYRLKKPKEQWGNYFSKIAFFNANGKLLYNNRKVFAHALTPFNLMDLKLNFVYWSPSGGSVLLYEYRRSEIYSFVVLDFKISRRFVLNIEKKNNEFIRNFISKFKEIDLDEYHLNEFGFSKECMIKNKFSSFLQKWYP